MRLKPHRLPLMTTECWGVVDFKDWPLLSWDWVKELCRIGLETAAATGQWLAIATSNFAGPQFRGMWRDVRWHQSANDLIKRSAILPEFEQSKLAKRLWFQATSWRQVPGKDKAGRPKPWRPIWRLRKRGLPQAKRAFYG